MKKTLYLKFILAYFIFGVFGFIIVTTFVPNMTKEHLIREKAAIQAGGVLYGRTTKEKMGAFHKILADLFWFYNRGGAMLKYFKRRRKDKIENPVTPVDPIEIPYLKKAKKFRSKK